MSKDKLILIGGGGHCHSVIDVVETQGKYSIIGILDMKEKVGAKILGYEVIGTDEDLPALCAEYKNFLISIGQIKSFNARTKLYMRLLELEAKLPVIVSPFAYVSKHARIASGTIVMHRSVINAGAFIAENCILNTGSIVEHDARVNAHCHISTGAIINGDVLVGKGCFVGSQAVIRQGVIVSDFSIIGAGAVVTRDTEEHSTYVGNPARKK